MSQVGKGMPSRRTTHGRDDKVRTFRGLEQPMRIEKTLPVIAGLDRTAQNMGNRVAGAFNNLHHKGRTDEPGDLRGLLANRPSRLVWRGRREMGPQFLTRC